MQKKEERNKIETCFSGLDVLLVNKKILIKKKNASVLEYSEWESWGLCFKKAVHCICYRIIIIIISSSISIKPDKIC